jgi:hypothetical protein
MKLAPLINKPYRRLSSLNGLNTRYSIAFDKLDEIYDMLPKRPFDNRIFKI